MITDKKFCPVCGRENPLVADKCEHCGNSFELRKDEITTGDMRRFPAPVAVRALAPDFSQVPSDTLALFALGKPDPLVYKVVPRITLGRATPGADPPTVDLTSFGAKDLGVSRRHAMILYMDGEYKLVDLDSTNGTWLNEQQLIPNKPYTLRSTDQIRLGRLQLFVYFRREAEAAPELAQEDTLLFVPQPLPVSVEFVMKKVVPYLEDVQEVQSIIDELRGRGPGRLQILSLETVPTLKIKLKGAHEAVSIIRQLGLAPVDTTGRAVSQPEPSPPAPTGQAETKSEPLTTGALPESGSDASMARLEEKVTPEKAAKPAALKDDRPPQPELVPAGTGEADGKAKPALLKGALPEAAASRSAAQPEQERPEETTSPVSVPAPLKQALDIIQTFVASPSAASQITYTSRLLPVLERIAHSELVLIHPSAESPQDAAE